MPAVRAIDALGRALVLTRPPRRIVSLVPSETESVVALGAAACLVGRTTFCVEPRGVVESVATVGGTKDVDVDAVLALAPDLVLANQEENARKPIEALIARGAPVHVSFPRDVAGGVRYVRALAALLGLDPDAAEPVRAVEEAVASARASVAGAARGIPTFVPIWRDPWMTFDDRTFAGDVLAHVGATNVFGDRARRYPLAADVADAPAMTAAEVGDRDTRYPRTTLEELAARAPALVLLPDEPYAFAEKDAEALRSALPGVAVEFVDGRNLFWYGTRTASALSDLRRVVARHGAPSMSRLA